MGAWGTALYSNDTASDIRGDYVDLLRRGNSNEEALKKLMEKNRYCIGDEEEEPLFWYALADTLWNYGRLTPEVKEKALYFLEHPEAELARWEDEGGKHVEAWMRTLEKLRTKLLSRSRWKRRFQSIVFINVHGRLAMFMRIDWKASTAEKKDSMENILFFKK